MPHVVNGIGTWYWGKNRIHGVHSVCEHCGHIGELLSYDTRSYFVVLFIPVIPLGRKRVIHQCPSCKRHGVVRYRDWRRRREHELPEAVEAFRVAPRDRARAISGIGMAMACQDESALNEIAALIHSSLARDAELQAELGDAYAYFSQWDAAEHAYRTALKLDDCGEVRDDLARVLLLQSRPDEAWELISGVLTEEGAGREGLALLVAESYQAWGMHDAAQTILDETISAFPSLEQDPDYRKLRRSVLKYQGTQKRLKPKLLRIPKGVGSRGPTLGRYVPMSVAAVAVLVAVSGFTIASLDAAHDRLVHVANGLSVPYRVSIDGKTVRLHPHSILRMEIDEGDVVVSVLDEAVAIPDQHCEIRTDFFTRPFVDHLFVINPDRTALMLWEETEYSEHPGPDLEHTFRCYCGDLLLSWTDVDYPFQEFPEEVLLAGGSNVRRSRVAHLDDLPVPTVMATLAAHLDHTAALQYLRRKVELDRDDSFALGIFARLAEPDAAVEVLRRLCRARPVRVEAHRVYQSLVDQFWPEVDLVAEYRELLAEAPDDPARLYLLGRILQDNDEAEDLFTRATTGAAPTARAFGALAYNRLTNGAFDEAMRFGARAIETAPDNAEFKYIQCLILSALERFDEALELHTASDEYLWGPVADEVYYLARIGDPGETDRRIEEIARESAAQEDEAAGDEVRNALRSMVAYVQGDLDGAIRYMEPVTDSYVQFARAVMLGDLHAARVALDTVDHEKANAALLLSLLLRDAGDVGEADRLAALAAELLQVEGSRGRRAASWLTGESQLEPEDVLRIGLEPGRKAILLVALGRRFPEHQQPFFNLGRRLNFDLRFPHRTVRSLTDGT